MEGTIRFVSKPGEGTQFTIVIPFLVDRTMEKETEDEQGTDEKRE